MNTEELRSEFLIRNIMEQDVINMVYSHYDRFITGGVGRSSIGVRQNKHSWFKGSIYKIRITPNKLIPDQFMTY